MSVSKSDGQTPFVTARQQTHLLSWDFANLFAWNMHGAKRKWAKCKFGLHPCTRTPQKQIRCLKVRSGGQTGDYIFIYLNVPPRIFFLQCPPWSYSSTLNSPQRESCFLVTWIHDGLQKMSHPICDMVHIVLLWQREVIVFICSHYSFPQHIICTAKFSRVFTKSDDWNEQIVKMKEHFILLTNNTFVPRGSEHTDTKNSTQCSQGAQRPPTVFSWVNKP